MNEAAAIDVRIAAEWSGHPRRFVVEPTEDFLHKAAQALSLLRSEAPECCRHHVRRFFWDDRRERCAWPVNQVPPRKGSVEPRNCSQDRPLES
jgi:hypothetical protein